MIYGMPTLIEIETLSETMEFASERGLDFVELNMNLPAFQVEQLEKTDILLKLQQKYGIGYTIHLDENLNVCDFNQAVAEAYCDTVRRTIAVAKKINAPVLNMHINHGVHFTLPNGKVQLFEKYNTEYEASWERFLNLCETEIRDADIKICMENTDGFLDFEKRAMEVLLKSEVFALTWDIGHCNSHGDIDEVFLMQHEEKLSHFHIHDSAGGKDHMTLGTGEIDLKQRLAIAERHNCRCVVETKTKQALKESISWLNISR